MFWKKSARGKRRFSLPGIFLHPATRIFGGLFSVLAAAIFGGFRLSRRRKKKAIASDSRLVSSRLMVSLGDVRSHLADFRIWFKKQEAESMDIGEIQVRYAGLKGLYNEWTSHERMEKILGTVQYDPQIGINVSNGLHELRGLNILLETILRDELQGTEEGKEKLDAASRQLESAIGFFSYISEDLKTLPESEETNTA